MLGRAREISTELSKVAEELPDVTSKASTNSQTMEKLSSEKVLDFISFFLGRNK